MATGFATDRLEFCYDTSKMLQKPLFSFEELTKLDEENEKIQSRNKREKILQLRKELVLNRYEEPKNDNERMINFQFDYLTNGSEYARGQLWLLAYKMAWNLLKKELGMRKIFLSDIEQEIKVNKAIDDVMKRYDKIYYRGTKQQKKDKLFPYAYSVKNYVIQFEKAIGKTFDYITDLEKNTVSFEEISLRDKREYGV